MSVHRHTSKRTVTAASTIILSTTLLASGVAATSATAATASGGTAHAVAAGTAAQAGAEPRRNHRGWKVLHKRHHHLAAGRQAWTVRVRGDLSGRKAKVVVRRENGRRWVSTPKAVSNGRWTTFTLQSTSTNDRNFKVSVRSKKKPTRPLRVPPAQIQVTPTAPQNGQQTAPQESQPTTPGTCTTSKRGIPCAPYLGMAYGSNTDPSSLEKNLGAPLGVRRTYYRADQVAGAVRNAKADLAAGRLPWISFKLPSSWSAMASGSGDAWARDIAAQLAKLNGPVWVAFHHEPEGDGAISDWRKMQERLAPIMRKGAPNVAFTVVLTGWHQFYGPSEYSLDNIWPRNVQVDVAGFDVYNSHGVVKNGKVLKPTDMDEAYFAKIDKWADQKGVAWGLAETGYTDTAVKEDPTWIARTTREMAARGGVAMTYFNTSLNSIAPWNLNDAKLVDYRAAMKGTALLARP